MNRHLPILNIAENPIGLLTSVRQILLVQTVFSSLVSMLEKLAERDQYQIEQTPSLESVPAIVVGEQTGQIGFVVQPLDRH